MGAEGVYGVGTPKLGVLMRGRGGCGVGTPKLGALGGSVVSREVWGG